MSLQVWLPLNNNLNNQGLSITTPSSSGTLSYTTGKLTAKGLTFSGGQKIDTNFIQTSSSFTYSCWYKTTSSTAGTVCRASDAKGLVIDFSSSTAIRVFFWYSASAYRMITCSHNFTANTWYLITVTYDKSKLILYINGIEKANLACTDNLYSTGTDIVGYGSGYGYLSNAVLNDFRIYDHALSKTEVAKLADGLMLDYQFNDSDSEATTNLMKNTDFANGTSYWFYSCASNVGSTATIETDETFVKYIHLHKDAIATNWSYIGNNSVGTEFKTLNETYTISGWIKKGEADPRTTCQAQFKNGNGTNLVGNSFFYIPLSTTWHYFTHTFTVSAVGDSPCFYVSSNNTATVVDIYFANVQLEKNDHATPWCPTQRSIGYLADGSGYQNNFDLVPDKLPTFQIDTSSPASEKSIIFSGSQYVLSKNNVNTFMPTDAISVCWWGYMDNWANYGRAISCTEGGGWNFEPKESKMSFPLYRQGTGYINALDSTDLSVLSTGWHFFVGTYDGYTARLYIDSVLKGTSSTYSTKATISYPSVKLFLGCEAATTAVPPYFTGRLASVKIYATALSTERIKNLYQIRQKIDTNGNLYGKVSESNTTIKFNKNGIISSNGLTELFTDDSGATWIPFCVHNNHSGTNLFVSSGYDFTKPIYMNTECWCNFGLLNGVNHGPDYEIMVIQQEGTENAGFAIRKFKQTVNPMTATWEDVKPNSTNVTLLSNMPTSCGGMYFANYSNGKMVFANGNNGNWFCCGACASLSGGIPGIANATVKGYQICYIRVYSSPVKLMKSGVIIANEFKEN